jgi:hypothetical protein
VIRAGLLAALALAGALPAAGAARPALAITSFRLVAPDGATVQPPVARGSRPEYRIEYRIGGTGRLRVTRRLQLVSPEGILLDSSARSAAGQAPGRYFTLGTIRVRPGDPKGVYVIRYRITVREAAGARVTRGRRMFVRFT